MRVIPNKIQERVRELRRKATHAEMRLLIPLRILAKAHDLALVFQCPLSYSKGWAIIDFVLGKRMGIELDGKHHLEDPKQIAHDRDRDSRLEWEYNIRIIRTSNSEVMDDPLEVAIRLVDLLLHDLGRERKMSRIELEAIVQQHIFEGLGIGFIT